MLSFHFYLWGLGLCPADSFDEATADMISDGVTDLFQPLSNMYHEKDETKKVLQKLMSVSVPHIKSLPGFTPDCNSVGLFHKIVFAKCFARYSGVSAKTFLSDARQPEVNFL